MERRILAIDPGVKLGYALITSEGVIKKVGELKIEYDDFRASAEKVKVLISTLDPSEIVIEVPEYWASYKGKIYASKGFLVKMSMLVGIILGIAHIKKIKVFSLAPRDWKGQLPNKLVKQRVEYLLGKSYKSQHIIDAIGIGLFHLGRF